MEEHKRELKQLNSGQMFFPPEVLLVLRSHRRHHIIKVHYYVDQVIHQVRKCSMAAGNEFHANPRLDRCERMMVQVEQTDLIVLFPHHEKYRVNELR